MPSAPLNRARPAGAGATSEPAVGGDRHQPSGRARTSAGPIPGRPRGPLPPAAVEAVQVLARNDRLRVEERARSRPRPPGLVLGGLDRRLSSGRLARRSSSRPRRRRRNGAVGATNRRASRGAAVATDAGHQREPCRAAEGAAPVPLPRASAVGAFPAASPAAESRRSQAAQFEARDVPGFPREVAPGRVANIDICPWSRWATGRHGGRRLGPVRTTTPWQRPTEALPVHARHGVVRQAVDEAEMNSPTSRGGRRPVPTHRRPSGVAVDVTIFPLRWRPECGREDRIISPSWVPTEVAERPRPRAHLVALLDPPRPGSRRRSPPDALRARRVSRARTKSARGFNPSGPIASSSRPRAKERRCRGARREPGSAVTSPQRGRIRPAGR